MAGCTLWLTSYDEENGWEKLESLAPLNLSDWLGGRAALFLAGQKRRHLAWRLLADSRFPARGPPNRQQAKPEKGYADYPATWPKTFHYYSDTPATR